MIHLSFLKITIGDFYYYISLDMILFFATPLDFKVLI